MLDGGHRPSYHHPRKQIKHNRKKEPAFCCPNVGRICYPFFIGLIGAEVALEQVGSHLCVWLTMRRHGAMTWTFCKKSLFAHQTCYPLPRPMNSLGMQFSMHAWAPIHATVGMESCLHFLDKLGI